MLLDMVIQEIPDSTSFRRSRSAKGNFGRFQNSQLHRFPQRTSFGWRTPNWAGLLRSQSDWMASNMMRSASCGTKVGLVGVLSECSQLWTETTASVSVMKRSNFRDADALFLAPSDSHWQ